MNTKYIFRLLILSLLLISCELVVTFADKKPSDSKTNSTVPGSYSLGLSGKSWKSPCFQEDEGDFKFGVQIDELGIQLFEILLKFPSTDGTCTGIETVGGFEGVWGKLVKIESLSNDNDPLGAEGEFFHGKLYSGSRGSTIAFYMANNTLYMLQGNKPWMSTTTLLNDPDFIAFTQNPSNPSRPDNIPLYASELINLSAPPILRLPGFDGDLSSISGTYTSNCASVIGRLELKLLNGRLSYMNYPYSNGNCNNPPSAIFADRLFLWTGFRPHPQDGFSSGFFGNLLFINNNNYRFNTFVTDDASMICIYLMDVSSEYLADPQNPSGTHTNNFLTNPLLRPWTHCVYRTSEGATFP